MKILIQNPIEPILEGIAQVLTTIKEELIIWDGQIPLNDLLDRYNPELTICYGGIKSRPKLKLIIVGEYIPYKNINPDLICVPPNHHISSDKHLVIETAANFTYRNIQYDENYATDLFYYSHNTTPDVLEYLVEIEKQYQLKIIGQHRLPIFSYLGVGITDDIIKFMKSCKIALTFDLPSLYTYAANKVFCVTNQKNDFFPVFNNVDTLKEHIDAHLYDKLVLQSDNMAVEEAHDIIIHNHTYFHRTHDIFTRLEYPEQAEKCLTQLQNIIKT